MDLPDQTVPGKTPAALVAISTWLMRAEQAVCVLFLVVIVTLSCCQILLRWSAQGGLIWIDPLLRQLVLWGGLLGAVLATAKGEHITIDVIGYLLTNRLRQWLSLLVNLLCLVVSLFLVHATMRFMSSEFEFGGNGLFDLPSWVLNAVFPVAFILIFIHFLINTILIATGLRTRSDCDD